MAYEPKDGDISVFKNNKKEKDSHPDYTGKAQINGETYYVSFWIKKRDGGDAFFSGQIQKKKEQSGGAVEDPLNPSHPTAPVDPLDSPLSDDSPAPADTSRQQRNVTPVDDGLPF